MSAKNAIGVRFFDSYVSLFALRFWACAVELPFRCLMLGDVQGGGRSRLKPFSKNMNSSFETAHHPLFNHCGWTRDRNLEFRNLKLTRVKPFRFTHVDHSNRRYRSWQLEMLVFLWQKINASHLMGVGVLLLVGVKKAVTLTQERAPF